MKETKTVGGDPAYSITINTIFTLRDFCVAMADYAYEKGGLDFKTLTRKDAIKILKHQLKYHGRNGTYEAFLGDGNGLGQNQEEHNKYFDLAKNWATKNYPYLKTK